MTVLRALALAVGIAALDAPVAFASDEAQRLLDSAARDCADYEGGVFTASPTALIAVDLTGDRIDDEIVDQGLFVCSSTEAMFCGSVGCTISAIVDGERFSWVAYSWTVVDWEASRILLLSRHGDICATGPDDPCYEALVWNGDRFVSVAPPQ
jgi:hypothetical protein